MLWDQSSSTYTSKSKSLIGTFYYYCWYDIFYYFIGYNLFLFFKLILLSMTTSKQQRLSFVTARRVIWPRVQSHTRLTLLSVTTKKWPPSEVIIIIIIIIIKLFQDNYIIHLFYIKWQYCILYIRQNDILDTNN